MVQIYIQGLGYVDVSKNTGDKYELKILLYTLICHKISYKIVIYCFI